MLGGGAIAARQTGRRLTLTLPEQTRDPSDTVIKLDARQPGRFDSGGGRAVRSGAKGQGQANPDSADPERPQVAVYYFPNYHPGDPRNTEMKGETWSEWELVKAARPRFPGHAQPKVPLWGYGDESDPAVMARKIDAAADHGVDAFIFDWYYYDMGHS